MERTNDVTCLIWLNNHNDVLMQKKDSTHSWKNIWTLFGGRVEVGEHPNDCIQREIVEETGLILNDFKLYSQQPYFESRHNRSGDAFIYEARFNFKLSDISLKEGGGFATFERDELDNLYMNDWQQKVLFDYYNKLKK